MSTSGFCDAPVDARGFQRSSHCDAERPNEGRNKPTRRTRREALTGKLSTACGGFLIVSALFVTCQSAVEAQTISLGAAQNFAILGGSTVTNTGPTLISGNVG